MDHFIRTAFWILTLSAGLQARHLPLEDAQINFMRDFVNCTPNSTFYAPKNVEEECITTALDCIMRELNATVREECTDSNDDLDQSIAFFKETIKKRTEDGHATTNSSECACERWSQTPFRQFLNQVESLVLSAITEEKNK